MFQHLTGNVPCDVLNRLVAGTALGQFGDQSVTVVMPAALYPGIGADLRVANGRSRTANRSGDHSP
jgi:hypothetical protein